MSALFCTMAKVQVPDTYLKSPSVLSGNCCSKFIAL